MARSLARGWRALEQPACLGRPGHGGARFNASRSSDPDGDIVNCTWDFGDGVVSYGNQTVHQYADNGTYMVSLTVTDDDGATDDYEQNISVLNNPPTAYIDSISPNPAVIGETVFFNGHGVDIDGIVVAWQWNSSIDGSLSIQPSFDTILLSLGTHTISLIVKDDDGGNGKKQSFTKREKITKFTGNRFA